MKTRKLRLVLFGGTETLERVLRNLRLRKEHTILGVFPREDASPAFLRSLGKMRIPVLKHTLASPELQRWLKKAKPDLLVSAVFRGIFPKRILAVPRIGTLNVHGAVAPAQRGAGGVFGAFLNGEDAGCTVHWVDEGIDTGDILLTRRLEITPETTMRDYLAKAYRLQADALLEAIAAVADGSAGRASQLGSPYAYFPRKAPWEEYLDWTQPTRVLHAKIRARNPGPLNFTLVKDRIIHVLASSTDARVRPYLAEPGLVVGRHPRKGVLVKTGDTALWISLCTHDPSPGFGKRPKYVFRGDTFIPSWPIGTRLGYHLPHEIFKLQEALKELRDRLS